MSAPLDDALASYYAARVNARARQREATLASLTDRERSLVREAAVMGYVQGLYGDSKVVPKDSAIVALVVEAALALPDLYPTLASVRPDPLSSCLCPRLANGMVTTPNPGNCPVHVLPGCPNPSCGETWVESFKGDHCESCGWRAS